MARPSRLTSSSKRRRRLRCPRQCTERRVRLVSRLYWAVFFALKATLRGFLVILALSLHAVFEGIALGLTHSANSAWFLFFAIASHKYVISFCIGMQFVSSGTATTPFTILFEKSVKNWDLAFHHKISQQTLLRLSWDKIFEADWMQSHPWSYESTYKRVVRNCNPRREVPFLNSSVSIAPSVPLVFTPTVLPFCM